MDLWLIRTRAMLMVSRLLLLDLPPQQGRQWTAKKSRSLAIGLGKLQTEGMQIFHIHPSSCPVRLKTLVFDWFMIPFCLMEMVFDYRYCRQNCGFLDVFELGGWYLSTSCEVSLSFWGCSNDLQQPCKSMKYMVSHEDIGKRHSWTSPRKLKDIRPEYLFKERGTFNLSGRFAVFF